MTSSYTPEKLAISVVILTKNEEQLVKCAIESAFSDYDEIVVLDSFSSDATVNIATQAGATVHQNAFCGYASQRNHALKKLPLRNDWVFFLDADEQISHELTVELLRDFNRLRAEGFGMIYMRRKDYFMGKWIRRSSGYPTWFGRLCHAPSVQIVREINEEYHCSRPIARIREHLQHFPFAKGLSNWVNRHNYYSTAEAEEKISHEKADLGLVFSRDPGLRRKGLKQIYMVMPFRPLVGFLYLYVVRGGFMDGKAGFRFAMLRMFYEFMITLKLDEMRAEERETDKP